MKRVKRLVLVLGAAGLHFAAQSSFSADDHSEAAVTAETPQTVETGERGQISGARGEETLTEIVVTSTKRPESLENIPASIVAITGDQLAQRGTQNLADIVELVPGVNITTPDDNAARITIRGIAGEANTNPTAGILFGDISFMDAYVPHVTLDPNPFDMQSVEVLKGPQGTLFGASALNGAIRYVPEPPALGAFEAKYYAQAGSVSHGNNPWSFGAMVNAPLSGDALALRVVAFDSGTPGWVDNQLTHDRNSNRGEQKGARAILAWRPSEALHIDLTYAMQRTSAHDVADEDNLNGDLSSSDRVRSSPWRSDYDLASLNLGYDLEMFKFVSQTGYVWKDFRAFGENSFSVVPGGALPVFGLRQHDSSNSWSQEFRLVSNTGPASVWSWVAGVFASNQSIRQVAQYSLGDPSLAPQVTANVLNGAFGPGAGDAWLALGQPPYDAFDIDVRVKEMAGFFDVTRKLGGGWEASIGGRLYHTSSGGVATNTGFLLDLTGFVGGRTVDDTVRDNGFDPKASLSWHVSGDAMLYAAASKGYRVGGVQWGNSGLFASTPAPNLFKTDSIWNYEAGLRSRWLNDTLRFDSTVFYERWKNPQVLVFVSNGLGAYIDNVGGVESKGVETSLQYILPSVPGLKLTAAATYTDAKTTEDFVTAVASELITKGTTWPLSPKWQSAATIDYQHGFGSWYWGGYLTHAYLSGATYGIGQPDPVFGYAQLDAQLRFGATAWRTQPELSLTMTNVADRRGISTSYSGVFWQEVTYVQPRTLTLRVTGRL